MSPALKISPFQYRCTLRMMLEAKLRRVVVVESIVMGESGRRGDPDIDFARAVGVSRKALRRWVERYRAAGASEFDQDRALEPVAGEKWISRPVEMRVRRIPKSTP